MTNVLMGAFPTADHLLAASEIEIERALLRYVVEFTKDPMHRMAALVSVVTTLFGHGGYTYDATKRSLVEQKISCSWKALEDSNLIAPPDIDNEGMDTGSYRTKDERSIENLTLKELRFAPSSAGQCSIPLCPTQLGMPSAPAITIWRCLTRSEPLK
jgi:hypothetical protein